jgi:hypothetical protein
MIPVTVACFLTGCMPQCDHSHAVMGARRWEYTARWSTATVAWTQTEVLGHDACNADAQTPYTPAKPAVVDVGLSMPSSAQGMLTCVQRTQGACARLPQRPTTAARSTTRGRWGSTMHKCT